MARPRIHPPGTTAKSRARDALRASGGRLAQIELSAEANADLKLVRERGGETSDSAVVERLVRQEAVRLLSEPPASP